MGIIVTATVLCGAMTRLTEEQLTVDKMTKDMNTQGLGIVEMASQLGQTRRAAGSTSILLRANADRRITHLRGLPGTTIMTCTQTTGGHHPWDTEARQLDSQGVHPALRWWAEEALLTPTLVGEGTRSLLEAHLRQIGSMLSIWGLSTPQPRAEDIHRAQQHQ